MESPLGSQFHLPPTSILQSHCISWPCLPSRAFPVCAPGTPPSRIQNISPHFQSPSEKQNFTLFWISSYHFNMPWFLLTYPCLWTLEHGFLVLGSPSSCFAWVVLPRFCKDLKHQSIWQAKSQPCCSPSRGWYRTLWLCFPLHFELFLMPFAFFNWSIYFNCKNICS